MEKIYKVMVSCDTFFRKEETKPSVVATEYEVEKITEKSIMASALIDGKPSVHRKRFPIGDLNRVIRETWGDGVSFFTDDPEKIPDMVLDGLAQLEEKVKKEQEKVDMRLKVIQGGLQDFKNEGVEIRWQD